MCFSANTLTIHFAGDIAITSEALVVHECVADGGTEWTRQDRVPVESSGLMRLIGPVVVAAKVTGSADLLLEFEDGQVLRVEESSPYESYHIRLRDREIHI